VLGVNLLAKLAALVMFCMLLIVGCVFEMNNSTRDVEPGWEFVKSRSRSISGSGCENIGTGKQTGQLHNFSSVRLINNIRWSRNFPAKSSHRMISLKVEGKGIVN
jgi:hypothetical protein